MRDCSRTVLECSEPTSPTSETLMLSHNMKCNARQLPPSSVLRFRSAPFTGAFSTNQSFSPYRSASPIHSRIPRTWRHVSQSKCFTARRTTKVCWFSRTKCQNSWDHVNNGQESSAGDLISSTLRAFKGQRQSSKPTPASFTTTQLEKARPRGCDSGSTPV